MNGTIIEMKKVLTIIFKGGRSDIDTAVGHPLMVGPNNDESHSMPLWSQTVQ